MRVAPGLARVLTSRVVARSCATTRIIRLHYDGFGVNPEESQSRFQESIRIVQGLWTTPDFTYDGEYFLIGRNWRGPNREIPMELALIRFDPKSLAVEKHYVLDNEEQGKVTDGYYTCPILVDTGERKLLNVFTYKGLFGNSPDILRLQFDSADFLE